jgi:hypothetical protein
VQWSRIRAPPVGTPAHELHASECLEALRPGDHFEIQWRKNKDFPYGTTVPVPGSPACSAGLGERCRGGTTILLALLVQVLPEPDLIRCLLRCVAAGWWYGVVGHQAPCNPNEHLCRCHQDGKDSPPPSLSLDIVGSNTCGQDKHKTLLLEEK